MSQATQLGLDIPPEASQPAGNTVDLRLTVDHRRLFGALADGWLRPLDGKATQKLGVGRSVRESAPAPSRNGIGVRLALSASKLPNLDVFIHRNGEWKPEQLDGIRPADEVVHWPGAIPAFAIASLAVSSNEEKARLAGLSRGVSNVNLTGLPISVADVMHDCSPSTTPPCETKASLEIPPDQDAIHGALAMALWAVPRIDPWMDVLQASMAAGPGDPSKLVGATAAMDASWWRFAPWRKAPERPSGLAECLWLAALETFRSDCKEQQPAPPRDLLVCVADHALTHGGDEFKDTITSWQEKNDKILKADATVQLHSWRENPVGLAIQFVLTHPDPAKFKTWFKDRPDLPPGVGWSAATLCGLLNGYKRLATDFRGDPLQRELLAIKALSVCTQQSPSMHWPNGPLDLRWRREGARFVLSHGSEDFAYKPQHARGKWYAVDFANEESRRAASRLAEDLSWPCHGVSLADEEAPVSGPGQLSIQDGHLQVRGKATIHVRKAPNFDFEYFRRCIAIERGKLPAPPVVEADVPPTLPDVDIPGFHYEPNFLSEEDERSLIEWIDQQEWSTELPRRVQHYGWRYDYRGRKVDSSSYIGNLPAELFDLAQRLHDRKLVPQLPDQVIVNEYQPGQGISPHIDAPSSFADGIAMVSLLDSWEMAFHAPGSKRKGPNVVLEKGSVAIVKSDARYKWKHEIAKRKTDPYVDEAGKRRRRKRQRRISLTFRKVLQS